MSAESIQSRREGRLRAFIPYDGSYEEPNLTEALARIYHRVREDFDSLTTDGPHPPTDSASRTVAGTPYTDESRRPRLDPVNLGRPFSQINP